MKEYVTILHEAPGANDDLSPAEIQTMIGRYMEWTQTLRDQGRIVAEKSLAHGGGLRISGSGADAVVSDGPFSEGAELVGGLHVIKAENREEALAWAQECPALERGAWIELREVETWGQA